MTATRWDPVHDSRETFRRCVEATCRPGHPIPALTAAGLVSDPLLDRGAAVLLSLLDLGVGLAVVGGPALRELALALQRETGAAPAPVCDADFVLVAGGERGAAAEARIGTPLRPEQGATIVYAGDWPAEPVVLSGPGLREPSAVAPRLPGGELLALAAACAGPPAGLDAFIVAPDGLTALPRSVLRRVA